ncbi:hypothetical protein CXF85_02220 [Colwellia sp. 75C3]|uniref:SapC family protein n=1 Tax=Colwellia sp. 75C3 TaxID=888425 RepID=UPI000C34F882|nr:SapC family protein [Colwellia sp. 75C3]PKG85630.1 hypothetical protein CXF85_02220 [Colwellia sp. 75C3]
MGKLEKVSSEKHKHSKVLVDGVLANNANVHMSHIVLQEFAEVAQYYPIFLCKDSDTGQFQPMALFGLTVDENIYQSSGLWRKCYLPLKIQSQPFYLINDVDPSGNNQQDKPSLALDVDDNRVQQQQGNSLFSQDKATAYLQQQTKILADLTQGFVLNRAFITLLSEYDLIESVTLDIKYNNSQECKLEGLYSINQTMLEKVPTDIQKQFEQQGYVPLMSAMLSSINHVSTLIDIKNALLCSTEIA